MGLGTIAWANLWRRKGRTLFLLLTVVFSVGALTAMLTVTRAMRAEVGEAFDQIGANIMILPGASRRFGYAGVSVPSPTGEGRFLPGESVSLVRTIKNKESIAIVAPKLLAAVETENGPALAIGVNMEAESRLKKWWSIRVSRRDDPVRYAPAKAGLATTPDQVLLGSLIASRLGKDAGDTVVVEGRSFRVAGILDLVGGDEDRAIWTDLGVLQELSGVWGKVSLIEVAALCNTCPIEEIVGQLGEKLPLAEVSAVKATVAARQAVIDRFARFAQTLSIATAVLGGLAVILTMLGSVKERTREIGILRALGFRQGQILGVLYLEAEALGLGGGLAGAVLGTALGRVLGPAVAGMTIRTPWSPFLLAAGVAGAGLAMAVACTPPAIEAARTDPVKALRMP